MLLGFPNIGKPRAPTPPPRDPSSNLPSILAAHRLQHTASDDDSDSGDGYYPPPPATAMDRPCGGFYPDKPPAPRTSAPQPPLTLEAGRPTRVVSPTVAAGGDFLCPPPRLGAHHHHRQRSTPSPVPPAAKGAPHHFRSRSSPCPETGDYGDDSTDSGDPGVRLRGPCKGVPRSHRGSVPPPPTDCSWGSHMGAPPCCGGPMRYHWCGPLQGWGHCPSQLSGGQMQCNDDLQSGRISQLEVEKDQLSLQVNVLSEQVDAQNEKIIELENALSRCKEQLCNSEAQLRQEISSRSSAEGGKLDLMAQVSVLRLRLSTAEHEKQELQDRSGQLESELILTCACLAEKEADLATLKSRMARNGAITPVFENIDGEIEKLKSALSNVMAANDDKEKKIQEMKTTLNRYKKLQELVMSNPARRASDGGNSMVGSTKSYLSDTGSFLYCSDMEDIPESPLDGRLTEKPPPVPRQQYQLLLTAAEELSRPPSRASAEPPRLSPRPFPVVDRHQSPLRANSTENVATPPMKTPPSKRHYSTLPRPHQADFLLQFQQQTSDSSSSVSSPMSMTTDGSGQTMGSGQTSRSFHNLHHQSTDVVPRRPPKASPSPSSGTKGFFRLRSNKRSSSAPQLAEKEEIKSPHDALRRTESPLTVQKDKRRGLRKIFGRVKRSGSDSLANGEAEFRRGGIRVTAGPRLGWTARPNTFRAGDVPFREWDSSMLSDWLMSLGLSMYTVECKKWLKNGDQLLRASVHDFEKELGVKNPLHRKKLLLAVSGAKEESGSTNEPEGKLDHHWVIRWLDDVGLPQYKDAFFDARVDGRVLHHLTVEDLFHLKVTNLLHHISIKKGIQVLRENDFEPHALIRRSLSDDEMRSPEDVSRWSNHRVMEWLRTVDLSEYAPNLRGSGVHGGLIVWESRFTADLLASLLNIPAGKTLLRRHLSTQFKQLVGADCVQRKREAETQPGFCPLTPSAKVKAVRRGHFSLMRKKSKSELAYEDYVCPITFTEKMFGKAKSAKDQKSQAKTEEERFLMKESVLKNELTLDSMPASNV